MRVGGMSEDVCDKNVAPKETREAKMVLICSMIYEGKELFRPCKNRKNFLELILGLSLQRLEWIFFTIFGFILYLVAITRQN